jgi:general secretion pathway protein K
MSLRAIRRQGGAALLAAMLTVTLVAAFAATALWQQWQAVEIESAERSRVQAAWILVGALDWARLILIEDARAGGPDHLAEPWAVALQETRLSSFLAADKNNIPGSSADNQLDVFLSGQIEDMQSHLNVFNLTNSDKPSDPDMLAFTRLFNSLGLPQSELSQLAANLRLANTASADRSAGGRATLMPQRFEQLAWLGLSQSSIVRLRPYACLLPARTPVNLNTASAEVIYASVPDLQMSQAQQLVDQRALKPFANLEEAGRLIGGAPGRLIDDRHSVKTRFFEVRGSLRMAQTRIEERSLLQRDSIEIKTLWRERVSLPAANPPQDRSSANEGEALAVRQASATAPGRRQPGSTQRVACAAGCAMVRAGLTQRARLFDARLWRSPTPVQSIRRPFMDHT